MDSRFTQESQEELGEGTRGERLARAFENPDSSVRLQLALTAGTNPDAGDVTVLIQQCRTEDDFFVRDMLTWALVRHPAETVVPLLLAEIDTDVPQARSQALHTLSKIGDPALYPVVTDALLADTDVETARTAWRTAAGLVPYGSEADLARRLVPQLGRGDRETWRSLSRVYAELGEEADAVLAAVATGGSGRAAPADRVVSDDARLHAAASRVLIQDPDTGFEAALFDARDALGL